MRKDRKNILVPVDFQKASVNAAKYALKMAKKLNAEVFLLNIIETPGIMKKFFESGNHLVKITQHSKEQLTQLEKELSTIDDALKINSRVERGKRYERILAVAEDINARMIILGENHEGDETEKNLGSTVYHVTLKSSVPVLTIKGIPDKLPESIVVPLDLARETRKQLYSALVYGLNYGAKIHLVSSLIAGVKVKQSLIYKKMRNAKHTLEQNGVDCEIEILEKNNTPSFKRVTEYAESINAGMILLMTHKEGYNYDNYIGAFAHHIINGSKIPVLALTASATNFNFKEVIKGMVDPIGIFFKS